MNKTNNELEFVTSVVNILVENLGIIKTTKDTVENSDIIINSNKLLSDIVNLVKSCLRKFKIGSELSRQIIKINDEE